MDALLHEWKTDLLCIWIPLIAGAAVLIGLFGGMEIQGWRDAVPTTAATPTQTTAPTDNPKLRVKSREKPGIDAKHER
jgi:hypothetical protein